MKRRNALAYHRVREAIAAGIIEFLHIPGIQNPADILTKFLPYTTMWPLIEPILFWKGDTGAHTPRSPSTPQVSTVVSTGNRIAGTLTEGSNTNIPDTSLDVIPPTLW
jgi:hypothetical protein